MSDEVVRCSACPLRSGKEVIAPVPGEGPLDCTFLIIGRNPGALENQSGRPFIGPAGQRLDEMLKQLKVNRDLCRITNACLCFTIGNAPPPTPLLYQCAELHLTKELATAHPKVILVMGREAQGAVRHLHELRAFPFYSLLPAVAITGGADPKKVRIKKLPPPIEWEYQDGELITHVPIVYMVHPSAALRSPEFNARLLKQTRALKYRLKKWGLQ